MTFSAPSVDCRRPAGKFFAALTLLAGTPTLQADCDYDKGMEAFRAGERAMAEAALQECITAGESRAEAHFHLGILARNAGELEVAAAELGTAVSLAPEIVSYRLEQAVTEEWQGHQAEARSIYVTALEIEPGNLPARLGVARMDHWQGHLRRSLKRYRALLREYPEDRGVKSGLAFALMADNKIDESRALFEQLLADDPDDTSARKGLDMLAEMRTRKLEAHTGKVFDNLNRDIRQYRLAYSASPSYAIKWGLELVGRDGFVRPPEGSGVPVNRAIKSSQSIFGEYRFNSKTSAFGSLRREELAGDEDQYKLHLELMHKPADAHRLFAGAIPAWIDGDHVSTLSYAGYVFESDRKWSAMAQFYYGWDREFPDSKALSLSWKRAYGKRNWFRLGGSVSETSGNRSWSAYLSAQHYINRDFAISANLVENFSSNEREINLGVTYEF